MDVLLVIGDQDSYHDTAEEVVSSPIWLADILSDEGITGLFVLQARRAEILVEQQRTDVIRALRRHEIGLHGRDVHPVLPEIVEGLGWYDGVAALRAVEGAELELLGQVFETSPVCSSQHRNHAAPQIFGVARQLGMPYLFGYPAAPPLHSVSWYAGALNVPFYSPVDDFLGFFPSVFDDALPDDAAFEALFEQLQQHIRRCVDVRLPLLVVFACHPERLCYSGPVELWQYGNGRNRGTGAVPQGIEKRRTRSEIACALNNFRRLVRYLRDTEGLELTTVQDVYRRYGTQVDATSRHELSDLANRACGEHRIPISPRLSAAESLLGFAHAITHFAERGRIPDAVECQTMLGPLEMPPLAPELPRLDLSQIQGLARDLIRRSDETGHLPAALRCDGYEIGLGCLYGALAEAYLISERNGWHNDRAEVHLDVWPRYPEQAPALGERQRLCLDDPLVRPGLSIEATAAIASLQTWTLKPAQRI